MNCALAVAHCGHRGRQRNTKKKNTAAPTTSVTTPTATVTRGKPGNTLCTVSGNKNGKATANPAAIRR